MGLAESDPAEPPSRRAAPVAIGAWLLGFVIFAAVGSTLTPWPGEFEVTPKVEFLREHPGDVNAIYIGKSHVFRSFVPELIDARMAEAGLDFRSFNLGGPGMSDLEIDHLLRTVLAIEGLQLDYVFIEVPDWVTFTDENLDTNRAVNWHTLLQTRRAVGAVFESTPSWVGRAKLAWPHIELLWLRATGYGQGKRIVGSLLGWPEQYPLTPESVERELGYQALEGIGTPEIEQRRAHFVYHRNKYPWNLMRITARNQAPHDLERYEFDALARQIGLIRAAGARPVYIVPPSTVATPHAYALQEQGHLPDLMAFNQPEKHPLIYRFDRRFDGHLTSQGAEEFSDLFAQRLLALLDRGR